VAIPVEFESMAVEFEGMAVEFEGGFYNPCFTAPMHEFFNP
jgi:hypothetical protein